MVPLASSTVSKQRSERRISVRLPLKVRGRDASGFAFEEETSSENLCRNGAAFVTRFDVAIGSDLEIRIPLSQHVSRRPAPERFAGPGKGNGNRFTGTRFNERSEEHTSELQSHLNLVCRLLLEKKKHPPHLLCHTYEYRLQM